MNGKVCLRLLLVWLFVGFFVSISLAADQLPSLEHAINITLEYQPSGQVAQWHENGRPAIEVTAEEAITRDSIPCRKYSARHYLNNTAVNGEACRNSSGIWEETSLSGTTRQNTVGRQIKIEPDKAAVSPVRIDSMFDRLNSGDPQEVFRVSREIVDNQIQAPKVTDILADYLQANYQSCYTKDCIDTYVLVCQALGMSRNPGYITLLDEVYSRSDSRQLAAAAGDALLQCGGRSGNNGYQNQTGLPDGDVNAIMSQAQAQIDQMLKRNGDYAQQLHNQPISVIKEGMPMKQVFDLVGVPTSRFTFQTGKGYIPGYSLWGRDSMRTVYYYKNQGRIMMTRRWAHAMDMVVLSVELDPSEDGYR